MNLTRRGFLKAFATLTAALAAPKALASLAAPRRAFCVAVPFEALETPAFSALIAGSDIPHAGFDFVRALAVLKGETTTIDHPWLAEYAAEWRDEYELRNISEARIDEFAFSAQDRTIR